MAKKKTTGSYLFIDGKYLIVAKDRKLWASISGLDDAKRYVKDNNIILKKELV